VTDSTPVVSSETGKFSTDIAAELISAAVDSVEKHRQDGEELAVEPEAATEAPDVPEPDPLAELRTRLEASESTGRELEGQLKESREQTLRALADLDNARKRAQREREEVIRYGLERSLKDLLPVVDNLDRALDLGSRTGNWEGLQEGVRMTRKLLEDTLARQGLKAFSALGQPFDPHLHEAMGHEDRSDLAPGTVSSEVLRGFKLHDRLVRPALVMVARAPAEAASASDAVAETPPAASEPEPDPSAAPGQTEEG
jgi:molecular chaperone GrpE